MPSYDPAKVYYITSATVDKILYETPEDQPFTYTAPAGTPVTPTFSTQSTPHNLGVSVWPEAQYSIDGDNYYPVGARIEGAYDAGTMSRQYVECYVYADMSNVYFYVENGNTADTTFSVRYALESLS